MTRVPIKLFLPETYDALSTGERLETLRSAWESGDALWTDWLAALRSDIYIKTEGRLSRVSPNGGRCYCVSGVLCDVAGYSPFLDQGRGISFNNSYMPPELSLFMSLDACLEFIEPISLCVSVVPRRYKDFVGVPSINDRTSLSFADMANILEEQRGNLRPASSTGDALGDYDPNPKEEANA